MPTDRYSGRRWSTFRRSKSSRSKSRPSRFSTPTRNREASPAEVYKKNVRLKKRLLIYSLLALVLGISVIIFYKSSKTPELALAELQKRGIGFSTKNFLVAANLGKQDVVDLFLKAGIDPDISDESGTTPLMLASFRGHVQVVKLLVEKGGDPNRKNAFRQTPLTLSMIREQKSISTFLLKKGAKNPFMLVEAVREKNLKALKSYLKSDFDPNSCDPKGAPALHWAVQSADVAVVETLVKNGAKTSMTDLEFGQNPLMVAIQMHRNDIATFLLDHTQNLNQRDLRGRSALTWAVIADNTTMAQLLIKRGADVNVVEIKNGMTPLMMASVKGNTKLVNLLIASQAEIGKFDYYKRTALQWAVYKNQADIVRVLMDQKTGLSQTKQDLEASLQIAKKLHLQELEILLKSRNK